MFRNFLTKRTFPQFGFFFYWLFGVSLFCFVVECVCAVCWMIVKIKLTKHLWFNGFSSILLTIFRTLFWTRTTSRMEWPTMAMSWWRMQPNRINAMRIVYWNRPNRRCHLLPVPSWQQIEWYQGLRQHCSALRLRWNYSNRTILVERQPHARHLFVVQCDQRRHSIYHRQLRMRLDGIHCRLLKKIEG